MNALKMAFLALMLAAPLVFADVGPSPEPPKVVVNLVKDGAPAAGVESITYHCMGSVETPDAGAVEPQPIELACTSGKCTNEKGWYYKFNPCFSFPEGYFSYTLDGKEVTTESFSFDESYSSYEITIDAPSGNVTSKLGSSVPGCGSAFVLAAALLGALFARRA
ncbi:MAG: hypothetical protein AB1324_08550 [Candidatus Micrarchaeota archaeon]